MRKKPLDSKRAGMRNERLLLQLLRKKGPLSQKQLCAATGLGSSTASTIVSRLREKGLIEESPGQSTARGPKPVMLNIHPEGRFLVGVELSATALRIEIFNFFVESVAFSKATLHSAEANEVASQITIHVLGLLGKHRIDPSRVEGLGITVSGSVTPEGTVELSSTLGWRQVRLSELLRGQMAIPTHVFSTRVRLLTEVFGNQMDRFQNVLYLNVADGVGANAVIDGLLVHGAGNRAGEIGHIVIDPDGPVCGCGHTGCLEAWVSGPALAQRIRDDLVKGCESVLSDRVAPSDTNRTIVQKWGEAIQNRDPYALAMQELATEKLSRALAMAINLYDPQLIILAGYVSESCFDALSARIRESLNTHVYNGDSRELHIRAAGAGLSRYTKGAAIGVLTDETLDEPFHLSPYARLD